MNDAIDAASMSASPSGAAATETAIAAIGGGHRVLHRVARRAHTAAEADDVVETAVEIDDRAAAGALMQAIDVLGDELRERAGALPRRQRVMRGAGCGGAEARPAGERAAQ